MKKKRILGIAVGALIIFGILYGIDTTRYQMIDIYNASISFFNSNIAVIVGLMAIALFATIFWMLFGKKIEWFSTKNAYNLDKKTKIYSIEEMVASAKLLLRNLGVGEHAMTEGRKLHVESQFINAPGSDAPYGAFFFTTEHTNMDYKDLIHHKSRDRRHFVFVNRKTNEPSYSPDIGSWEEAFEWLEKLRMMDIPMEMKKKPMEKALEDTLKRTIIEKAVGKSMDDKNRGESNGKTERSEDSK